MITNIPEYGLAMSGGGARGLAHIGVIAALEENGISPGVISGSSMGAVIGALYAAGVSTDEMLNIARSSKLKDLFEWSFPKHRGMLTLKVLFQFLETHIAHDSFEALKKKLYIGASNISAGHIKIFSSGPLFQIVVASASIPIIFEPQIINGDTYVDGGLFNDLPIDPLVGKCEKIIASHVNYNGPDPELSSIRAIAERVYRLAIYQNVQKNFDKCDFIIDPPELREHGVFDFRHIDRLYQIGYEATESLICQMQEPLVEKPVIIRELNNKIEKIK